MAKVKSRKPTLYKHRDKWYVRIWDNIKEKYYSKCLGVKVEGKKSASKKLGQR